jgi:hypothetical protein
MTNRTPSNLRALIAIAALAASVAIPIGADAAQPADPAITGALPTRANRIVGLWETRGNLGLCTGGPLFIQVVNTLLFHAGGTVNENAPFPPQGTMNVGGIPGLYQRNQGHGVWSYDPATDEYAFHIRFDNFVDNVYHGYSTVDRTIVIDGSGVQTFGPVRAARYTASGTLISEFCGEAVSKRFE